MNPEAPYLGSSPDRIIYDPNETCPFGVLEVKCPMKDSYKESQGKCGCDIQFEEEPCLLFTGYRSDGYQWFNLG